MSEAPEAVQTSTPVCWCCGSRYDESDLVRLGSHPEVGVCFGCARFLQRQAAERLDERGQPAGARIRGGVRRARGWVIQRGWHDRPVIGGLLRRLDRHLP